MSDTPFAEIGGSSRDESPLTAVIVNDGVLSSAEILSSVEEHLAGVPHKVLLVDACHCEDPISLMRDLPSLRYLVPAKPICFTEAADRGIREARSRFVLLISGAVISGLKPDELRTRRAAAVLSPVQHHAGIKAATVVNGYLSDDASLTLEYSVPSTMDLSLTAAGGIGIYDARLYRSIGGFDTAYRTPGYAVLDYCYRAYAAGFPTVVLNAFAVNRASEPGEISEHAVDSAYFHCRNIQDPRYDKSRISGIFAGELGVTTALLSRGNAIREQRAWRKKLRSDADILLAVRTNILE